MTATHIMLARTIEIFLLFLLLLLMLMDPIISLELLKWMRVETITRL